MINYTIEHSVDVYEVIKVFSESGLKRPIDNPERIEKMYQHANLIITARDGGRLIGIARSFTDFCYCTYLADLAVSKAYQKQGIGKKLIEMTREKISPESSLLLVSAPDAMTYYPNVGFDFANNAFIIKRLPY